MPITAIVRVMAGRCNVALWPALLLLGSPCVYSQQQAPPDPPFIPSQLLPQTRSAAAAFDVVDVPSIEWTGHKSLDGLDPEPGEQKMLWFMNRARQDPTAEGIWLANIDDPSVVSARTYFNVDLDALQVAFVALDPKPPAAFDIRLHDASELHSLDLIARDAQDHAGQFDKVNASGFPCYGGRASVFSYTRSPLHGHAALNIDWGTGTADGMQDPPGHRQAIMGVFSDPGLTNVGLALIAENDGATSVGPLVFSGAYCKAGGADHNRFIVGTVWDDLDADGEYDEGEGIGGVMVAPDHGTYYAITGVAGGYAIPITSAGTYTVTFSGGDLVAPQIITTVDVGAGSLLLDALDSAPDTDGDGVPDVLDAFPDDPDETTDSDSDGIGDNSDPYPVGHFVDVPPAYPAYHFIEKLVDYGATAGCATGSFCPLSLVSRAQLAVIVERALHGGDVTPPPATGVVFLDVGPADNGAGYIEHLFNDGFIAGCGDGKYCPQLAVTREQVARLLLRLKYGAAHTPPTPSGLFDDVPLSHWAAAWIEELVTEGISMGCDADNYCPSQAVTRQQLAVLLVRALDL